ncbi:MAG: baeRF10 domain-containing protein [bacterium JZ-2024 1]
MNLLKPEVLREFRRRYSDVPMVSLYLPIDGRREKPENWTARFRNLVRKAGLSKEPSLRDEINKITVFLRSGVRDPSGRATVVFASDEARVWETAVVPYSVPERLVIGLGPATRPALENALIYEPIGVALVQRSSYEIDVLHGGDKVVLAHGTIEVPQRVNAGGWQGLRMSRIDRKQKLEEGRTYREIVGALEEARKKGAFSRFLLAGPKESLVTLKAVMPEKTRAQAIGETHLDTSFPEELLYQKAREALEAEAGRLESDVLNRIQAEASQGRNGVVGLEPTLLSVNNGTAETIAVSRHLTAEGSVCESCLALSVKSRCDHCGGSVRTVPDILEEAVWRIYTSGGRFVPVLNDRAFTERWGVGALLRFRAA